MRIKLHWQILAGLILGVIYGILAKEHVNYVSWTGTLFLRALKMLVIPLIVCSVISGISNIGSGKNLGRIGIKTIAYYITTSLFAIVVALLFINFLKPGIGANIKLAEPVKALTTEQQSIGQLLIEIVPENIFAALADNKLLSVLFFSLLLGIFITKLPQKHKTTLSEFFNAGFALFIKITMFVILFAPLGVFGLMAKIVAEQEQFFSLVANMSMFAVSVIAAILVHSLVFLPLLTRLIGRVNPYKHFQNMSSALLTAFSTASSVATLPLTMEGVENKSGVSKKITNFTLPIGATVNMDGTAIYIVSVVMFIAQANGLTMDIPQQIILVLTALLTSIGTAAIPMASLVIITIILNLFNLPLELIALILPFDRPLDMLRTTTNVWSDSCGAVIIAKTEGETLENIN